MSPALRVLFDATAVPEDRGGVGRYVDSLVAALDEVMDAGTLVVVAQHRDTQHYECLAPRAEVRSAPTASARRPARLAWEQVGLPRLARRVGANVLHSPHYTMPVRIGIPVVVTLHDATFFSDPQHHTAVKAAFFRSATRFALRRAAHTIVPSEATRDELVRILSVDPSRIEVAPHGVDTALFHPPSPAEIERARAKLGVTGEYIGFLGTLEPRKNAPSLIRGWIDAVKDRPAPPALVLAGAAGWDSAVDAAAAEVPERLTLLRPGYVDADDLAGFLGGALVVAYPSHGEGFGLPVLEAMACGAPVLTTKLLSLPEVGGDAVAYTDPSPVAIGEALAELLEDPARRSQLAAAGLERSRQFTWTASAQRHRDIYARVQRSR